MDYIVVFTPIDHHKCSECITGIRFFIITFEVYFPNQSLTTLIIAALASSNQNYFVLSGNTLIDKSKKPPNFSLLFGFLR